MVERRRPVKLVLRNVSKAFAGRNGSVTALEDVSLEVRQGEFVCLVGPSGCGKSTLLNLIAGLERPSRGEILMDGRPVTGPAPERMVLFQESALFPWLNVVHNVEFGLKQKGVPARVRREIALYYLEMVHLRKFAGAYVHELSGGMKQRVALARALAADPDVLLMDEPFAALDAQTRDILHAELQEIWAATRKTVVFITHNVREAVCLGDRVVVLTYRPGRVKAHCEVALPRPRQIEDEGLLAVVAEVTASLRGEVMKALNEELNERVEGHEPAKAGVLRRAVGALGSGR
ncbi:MAG: ABC transporter ATP-binding protein [Bacillota bacterium]|nr:ABC transporter ATP-binding protein [Bacillota bacterium]